MLNALIINDPFVEVSVDRKSIPQDMKIIVLTINNEGMNSNLMIEKERLFDFRYVSQEISNYIENNEIDLVAFPATKYMKMLAARVAIKSDVGLVADVIAVEKNRDEILLSRPAFEDQIVAKIRVDTKPIMFTSRILTKTSNKKQIQLQEITNHKIRIEQTEQSYKIEDYDLVFGCGFGFGNNYYLFEKLSDKLEFGIATTKKVTEQGWMEYSHQVGLSGKIIKPKIYIALGIEGTIHHVVGMQESDLIISVNTNPNAAINSISDYYLNQDCVAFVKQLIEELN